MIFKNIQLVKMLAALCLISTMVILHASSHLSPEKTSDDATLRVKRDIENPVNNIDPKFKLVQWFRNVIESPETVFKTVQEDTNLDYDKPKIYLLKKCSNDKYLNITEGLKNKNNNIQGYGTATFEENSVCRKQMNIKSIKSNFKYGNPNGKTIITYIDGSFSKANFEDGVLKGPLIKFWCRFGSCDLMDLEAWRVPKHLQEISFYEKGHRIGLAFEFKVGGGFVVGQVDERGNLSGPNISYIYPDLNTMIVGEFKNSQLISGLEAELKDVEFTLNGFLRPLYEVKGRQFMKYEISTTKSMGDGPLLPDPMEYKYCIVSNSTIKEAGRGVFLKRNAKKGQVIGFYNGVRMTDLESKIKVEDRKSPYRIDNDWATPSEIMNIPEKFRDLKNYNATLGHLINHSKKANTWFSMIDHPRFGKIRSIVMLKDVGANEELFVDYGYIEQYAASETAIKTILQMSKWFTDMDDESFHSEMKYHIKYLRNKVDEYKPYLTMLKGISNFLK